MCRQSALARLRGAAAACIHTSAPSHSDPTHVSNVYTRLTAGLPIIAGCTTAAGRGLFALQDIPAGQLLNKTQPVSLHAPPGRIGASVCPHCLRNLEPPASAGAHCSASCASAAKAGYGGVQERLGDSYLAFRQTCEDKNLLFPLIAARLACDVVAGKQPQDIIEWLCFSKGPAEQPPPQWEEGFVQLREGFDKHGISSDFFTRPWWFGALARIHINSFRVDLPRPLDRDDFSSLVEALDRGNGTALYPLPSLYNHDCEPNADVAWIDGDATMTVTARRNIAAGEEVRITYIDSMQTLEDRRNELRFGYGFTCECPLCLEEEKAAP